MPYSTITGLLEWECLCITMASIDHDHFPAHKEGPVYTWLKITNSFSCMWCSWLYHSSMKNNRQLAKFHWTRCSTKSPKCLFPLPTQRSVVVLVDIHPNTYRRHYVTSTSPMNHLVVQSQRPVRQVTDGRDGHLSRKQGASKGHLGLKPPGQTDVRSEKSLKRWCQV